MLNFKKCLSTDKTHKSSLRELNNKEISTVSGGRGGYIPRFARRSGAPSGGYADIDYSNPYIRLH